MVGPLELSHVLYMDEEPSKIDPGEAAADLGRALTARERKALSRERDKLLAGVRFRDYVNRATYDIVPIPVVNDQDAVERIGWAYYSVLSWDGLAQPINPPPAPYLASLAADHLRAERRAGRRRVTMIEPRQFSRISPPAKRPDDDELLTLIRASYAAGREPRGDLARQFKVSPNTVSNWLAHARSIPGNGLPAPIRGRKKRDNK